MNITPQTTVEELLKLAPDGVVIFGSGQAHHLVFQSTSLSTIAFYFSLPPSDGCYVVTSPDPIVTPVEQARTWIKNYKNSPDPEDKYYKPT